MNPAKRWNPERSDSEPARSCPLCGVSANQACRTPSNGRTFCGFPHRARMMGYLMLNDRPAYLMHREVGHVL